MNFNYDTGLIESLLTIDTTVASPINSNTNVLVITGTGAVAMPSGVTGDRPSTPIAGMLRFNSTLAVLEYYNGTSWAQLSVGGGTVTSVAVSAAAGGISISGSPITSSGTIDLTLDSDLLALANTATTGLYTVTGSGTSATRTLTGTAGNIVVTNGNGVVGNPTIDLATAGTPISNGFVKITTDAFGRVTASTAVTTSDITALVDSVYVNVAGDSMTGNLTFGGGPQTVTGLPNPTSASDAANKAYVDATVSGLSWKQAVRVATTAPGTLATDFENGDTVDGVVLATGDRILIKNQTTQTQNGIYIIQASGAPVRSSDADTGLELDGAAVFVQLGTVNADSAWVQTTSPVTIGSSNVVFAQFAGGGVYVAGAGLDLTGNVFSVNFGAGIAQLPSDEVGIDIYNYTGSAIGFADGGGVRVPTAAAAASGDTLFLFLDGSTLTQSGTGLKFRDSAALSVVGRASNTAGPVADIVAASDFNILRRSGTTVGFGAIDLSQTGAVGSSVLQITNGGTGLSTLGTANQFLAVNTTGTALEYKTLSSTSSSLTVTFGAGSAALALDAGLEALGTFNTTGILVATGTNTWASRTITAGTGISVTNGDGVAGNPTITNTGVTSFSAGTTGFTPNTATTGAVTLAGTLNVANGGTGLSTTPTNGQLLIGNGAGYTLATLTAGTGITITNGAGTITVASSSTLELYRENPSTPTTPVATGSNAVAIGSNSTSSATGAFGVGDGSDARIFGMKAFANGEFTGAGDAQLGFYVLRNQTTNNTTTELFLDGTAGTQRLVPVNNSVYTFDILVAARRTDATGGGAGYRFVGVIRKDTTAGSTTFVGTPSKTVIGETDNPWDANVVADTTNGSLRVNVTGQNAKTIRWVATVRTTEVTN